MRNSIQKAGFVKYAIVTKPLIWLSLLVLVAIALNQIFKHEDKYIKGTVLQIEYIDEDPILPYPSPPLRIKGQKILLGVEQSNENIDIFVTHDKRLFVGQIIEVQAEETQHKLIKIFK